MAITAIGGTGYAEQGIKRQWGRGQEEARTRTYIGLTTEVYELYETYRDGLAPTLDSLDYDAGRGKATLISRWVEEDPTYWSIEDGSGYILYELWGNDVYRDIALNVGFATLTDKQVLDVKQSIDNGTDGTALFTGNQLKLWTLYNRGTEEFVDTMYVLREVKVVKPSSLEDVDYNNDNRVDNSILNSLTNPLIGTLPDCDWLKKPARVARAAKRRWEIATEYWGIPLTDGADWSGWSEILYGGSAQP